MAWVEQSIEIETPLEQVWSVVTDYESYPIFLNDMRAATLVSGGHGRDPEDGVCVQFELQLIKKIRYTLCFEERSLGDLSWSLVKGDFMRKNEGGWRLERLGEGRCRASYRIAIAFGAIVPETITRKLAAVNLPATLAAFKKRAEALQAG